MLESNPGPLASQATTLTTRPWLLGQTHPLVEYADALSADLASLLGHSTMGAAITSHPAAPDLNLSVPKNSSVDDAEIY